MPFKHEKDSITVKSGQTQVELGDCGVSNFVIDPIRHSPEKPAPADPALSREWK